MQEKFITTNKYSKSMVEKCNHINCFIHYGCAEHANPQLMFSELPKISVRKECSAIQRKDDMVQMERRTMRPHKLQLSNMPNETLAAQREVRRNRETQNGRERT